MALDPVFKRAGSGSGKRPGFERCAERRRHLGAVHLIYRNTWPTEIRDGGNDGDNPKRPLMAVRPCLQKYHSRPSPGKAAWLIERMERSRH